MAAPPPRPDIDWANLSLSNNITVNGHIELRHSRSTNTWSSPVLVSSPNITVNGLCPGLNYGQQCYEGLKAFRVPLFPSSSETKIHIFRPEFHAARLARSAASVCLPCPSVQVILDALRLAVSHNAEYVPPHETNSYLYIRPVLFGASANLGLSPCEETILAIYVQPIRPYYASSAPSEGLDGLVLDTFDRAAPRGMGAFKVGGNYAPVWRHAEEAKKLGYGITLHLDSQTRQLVEEFSTSGFLGHYKKESKDVLVVPKTENAIQSATADSIVRLAELDNKNWVVERREVRFSEVGKLDEVVAVGTAASAVPIRSLSRLETGEKYTFGGNGRLTELAGRMADIQRGKRDDTEGWCWVVGGYEKTAVVVPGPGDGKDVEEGGYGGGISGYLLSALASRFGLWGPAKKV
ncbi:Aminotransferase [Naviculisporaceae sp. PSN 640]